MASKNPDTLKGLLGLGGRPPRPTAPTAQKVRSSLTPEPVPPLVTPERPAVTSEGSPTSSAAPHPRKDKGVGRKEDGRRTYVYVSADVVKALKFCALEEDTDVARLATEMLSEAIRTKYPAIAARYLTPQGD